MISASEDKHSKYARVRVAPSSAKLKYMMEPPPFEFEAMLYYLCGAFQHIPFPVTLTFKSEV